MRRRWKGSRAARARPRDASCTRPTHWIVTRIACGVHWHRISRTAKILRLGGAHGLTFAPITRKLAILANRVAVLGASNWSSFPLDHFAGTRISILKKCRRELDLASALPNRSAVGRSLGSP